MSGSRTPTLRSTRTLSSTAKKGASVFGSPNSGTSRSLTSCGTAADAYSAIQHPWLRIELALRAVLADRLTRGPSERVDQVGMARVKERKRIVRAGWFN